MGPDKRSAIRQRLVGLTDRVLTRSMVPLRSQRDFARTPRIMRQGYFRARRLGRLLDWSTSAVVAGLYIPGPEPVAVNLAGTELMVRPGTADLVALHDTFCGAYHRSPWALSRPLIVDLGANIGLTMVDYALTYPEARVYGVELDSANADLARRNTAKFGSRCRVVTGGVSSRSGPIRYSAPVGDSVSFSLGGTPDREGRGLTLDEALEELGVADEVIDLMKIDVEGAEAQVLPTGGHWAERTMHLLVEVHAPWTVDDCVEALQKLGFSAEPDLRHWAAVRASR
jgi:FkbM family methyltransferase